MKPTNNRVYCIGCRHPKMLFESQAKADNFIKFNRDEIASSSDKAPSRSYYCSFCCGWHVTSVEDEDKAEANDKRDEHTWQQIMSFRRKKLPLTTEGRELSEMIVYVHSLIQQCIKHLFLTNLGDALELYKNIVLEFSIIEDHIRRQGIVSSRIDRLKSKIKALQNTFEIIDEYDIDSDTRNLFLTKDDSSLYEWAFTYLQNRNFIATVNSLLSELEKASEGNDISGVSHLCDIITDTVNNYRGKGIAAKKKEFLNKLVELRRDSPKETVPPQKNNKGQVDLYLSIINLLEQAFQAIGNSDYKRCNNLIKTAECLMPDSSDEICKQLWMQIKGLKNQLSYANIQ